MPDNGIARSVEIPKYTSIKGDNSKTVFHGYHKGGVTRNWRVGVAGENCQKTIFECGTLAENVPLNFFEM